MGTELIAFLLPPLIDLINRKVQDTDARFWVSVLACVITGIILELLAVGLQTNIDEIVKSVIFTFGLAQLSYKGLYEGSKIQNAIRNTPKVTLPELKK